MRGMDGVVRWLVEQGGLTPCDLEAIQTSAKPRSCQEAGESKK